MPGLYYKRYRGIGQRIPVSTVVENSHDRQRCNAFGDVERFYPNWISLSSAKGLLRRPSPTVDDDFETLE
jgi:hypothetical protein